MIESNEALADLAGGYAELQRLERHLDRTITRKRVELSEQMQNSNRPWTTRRKMQLTLRTECEDQSWQNGSGGPPKWTLKLDGYVLPAAQMPASETAEPDIRFSNVVAHVLVESDKHTLGRVEWHRPTAPVDGLSITRAGSENVRLRITFTIEQSPDRYKLPQELGGLLDIQYGTRAEITTALWAYARKHNLVDSEIGKVMRFDEPLGRIFKSKNLHFAQVQDLLSRVLHKGEQIILEHTIVVDRPTEPSTYEMLVDLQSPTKLKVHEALLAAGKIDTTETDESLAANALAIRQARIRRDFLAGFADDPVTFLQTWTASQAHDLGVILGDDSNDDLRRAEAYKQPYIVDSIRMHDARRIVAGQLPNKIAR